MIKSDSWYSEYPKYTFNEYSNYLKALYGQPVYRVSVDAGFTCPNREQSKTGMGCIYCEGTGSRAPYLGNINDLKAQVRLSKSFLEARYGAKLYALYFQAFSNTNAPAGDLQKLYDSALEEGEFCELIVSTRPDCIDEEKARLLESYANENRAVWIELGLQSANSDTLNLIKRGHSLSDFEDAYRILKDYGLKIAVHVIFGLPGEGSEKIEHTINYLASIRPDGIKIHNLHIPRDTEMARIYARGEIVVPGLERHLEYVIKALELLPKKTVIMRLTCDTPKSRLISPRNFGEKERFYSVLKKEMARRNTWQGKSFND